MASRRSDAYPYDLPLAVGWAALMGFGVGVIVGELDVHPGVTTAALLVTGPWRIGGVVNLEHDRHPLEMRLNRNPFAAPIVGLGAPLYP